MSFSLRLWFLLLVVGLPACGGGTSPLLRNVEVIRPDGSIVALADRDLSPFQQVLRARLAGVESKPRVEEIFAAEMMVPEGQGYEGEYLAIVRAGKSAELRYFEQVENQPRLDRFFYRTLGEGEWEEFSGFLRTHPLNSFSVPAAPTTRPEMIVQQEGVGGAEATQPPPFEMLLTDAQRKASQSMLLQGEALEQPGAKELVRLLHKLRDGGNLTCSYYQPIPPNSRLLFAEPFRAVLGVWAQGDDVRALVSPPWHPLDAIPTSVPAAGWMVAKDGGWSATDAPPEPPEPAEPVATASAPASGAAVGAAVIPGAALVPQDVRREMGTGPAGTQAAVPATRPSPFSATDLLPKEEYWTAEPRGNFTAVTHYIPINAFHAQRVEFWVPTFQFDDEHMWVDAPRGTLYLIHDGELFALPIPPAALAAH